MVSYQTYFPSGCNEHIHFLSKHIVAEQFGEEFSSQLLVNIISGVHLDEGVISEALEIPVFLITPLCSQLDQKVGWNIFCNYNIYRQTQMEFICNVKIFH